MARSTFAALLATYLTTTLATPNPVEVEREAITPAALLPRATSTSITNQNQLLAAFSSFSADIQSLSAAISVGEAIFTNIVPAPGPTAIPQLLKELQTVNNANPGDIFKSGAEILLNGFSGGDYANIAAGYLLESSTFNINLIPPKTVIYPKADPADAPYDISEATLRSAIYIPPTFTYGKIQPVIFVPGTGVRAGQTWAPTYGKLFKQNKIADAVYLNLPSENLDDIQASAEYIAYAVNYISSISGRNVSTISWSSGSVSGQWALKYWPSIRKRLSNKISFSPDYHGTIFAQLLCPGFVTPGSDPAVCQQNYNSTFIRTLRNNGGDSAYVPTTNIYTIFDEIVEPQQDPNASGALLDARGVGVSNTEIQSVCTAFLPGGTLYNSHEGVIYNALGYALVIDALTNGGPGRVSRVNATFQCSQFATPGLSLADIFATEALIPIAAFQIIAFLPKSATEPPIKGYAQKDIPA
ncbi:hypothetical protein M409DRAFT_55451 [Zasmidium cellare ATCC 36951]|uniref:Alpha/beta-hydrolase n=1 Tax=Zasmidium cellare ATCC 36951 TaxID=1080233 RepID=A0A6A6CIU2_ZASCE|nr:uncharacterized protein M409DRAFT_55451 [Zasmidium cellare ATCC 36951]KAF2166108.1 hypothetical protein M409DRAFT_55451 [Zasmidium cellare ATCC 36951]